MSRRRDDHDMVPENTEQVDLFTPIHKGLRASMYDTAKCLARTNYADAEEKAIALDAVERVLGFLDEHLVLEDKYIEPLLQAASPSVARTFFGEHREHEALSATLTDLKIDLRVLDGPRCIPVGTDLTRTFNQLVAEQSLHMNREEEEVSPALWAAYDPGVLEEARAVTQFAIPAERYAEWMAMVFPALNLQEIVGILRGTKASSSPVAFATLCAIAEKSLGPRWDGVRSALGD